MTERTENGVMLLRRRNDDEAPNPPRFTVGQAVEAACREPPSFEGDAMERAMTRVAQTAGVLGRLVQALHEEGALDGAAVLQIVGDVFQDAADVQGGDAENTA